MKAIPVGSKVLKCYLERILFAAHLGSHLAQVKSDPTMEQVGAADMVVYITTSSLARAFAFRNNYSLSGGSADGLGYIRWCQPSCRTGLVTTVFYAAAPPASSG